uniref:LRRCT domain-containing protein n=1 Tax=Strigamia maritima TaxID=126957 RepID=T1IWD5_STRMM
MKILLLFVLFALISSLCASSIQPITCPSACYCDDSWVYVNCVGDGILEVPQDIPSTVSRLELRNFAMGTLTAIHLTGLNNMTELKLQQTQIEKIDDGTFAGLSRLVRLDLSQNFLENITRNTFSGLLTLRYFDLSSNQLVNMSGAFEDMENIEQLNLRDNQLKHLTSETFVGLQRVQYLNLDSNDIATIDIGTFQSLTHLVHLILSNNPLSNLTRLDFFSARLLYIDVSHVGILRVPQSLTQMVRDLRLAKNNLTHIRRGDFDSYPHLGLLVLDDNQITEIENDALGRQESLLRLWLNGNLLRKVPSNLPPTLKTLYIEENQLEALPPYAFQGLTNVEQLFLQRNKIKNMSICAFCDLLSLRSLDLQSNLIESIQEGVFANMSQLDLLDLSQNPLQVLQTSCFVGADSLHILRMSRVKTVPRFNDGSFDALKRLEVLELYDSAELAQLILNSTRVLHVLRNIRELNLMNNNIQNLRQDFLHFFPGLREIKLSGNIWHCNPSILWMAQWIKRAEVQFYRSYSIRCLKPPELQNKPVMTLTEADFPSTISVTASASTSFTAAPTTAGTTTTEPTTTTTIQKIMRTFTIPTVTPVVIAPTKSNLNINTTSTTVLPTTTENTVPTTTQSTVQTTTQSTIQTTTQSTVQTTIQYIVPTTQKTTKISTTTTLPTTNATRPLTTTKQFTAFQPTTTTKFQIKLPKAQKPATESSSPAVIMDDNQQQDQQFLVAATSLISGILLVILGSAAALLIYRCHHNASMSRSSSCPVVKRSGSISYSPQRDEVSIVTVSEGTFGLKTATHNGLGNKLYFIMDNGKDTLPETDLHELLPPTDDNSYYPYSPT